MAFLLEQIKYNNMVIEKDLFFKTKEEESRESFLQDYADQRSRYDIITENLKKEIEKKNKEIEKIKDKTKK
jgi:RecA/RadA recombinase